MENEEFWDNKESILEKLADYHKTGDTNNVEFIKLFNQCKEHMHYKDEDLKKLLKKIYNPRKKYTKVKPKKFAITWIVEDKQIVLSAGGLQYSYPLDKDISDKFWIVSDDELKIVKDYNGYRGDRKKWNCDADRLLEKNYHKIVEKYKIETNA